MSLSNRCDTLAWSDGLLSTRMPLKPWELHNLTRFEVSCRLMGQGVKRKKRIQMERRQPKRGAIRAGRTSNRAIPEKRKIEICHQISNKNEDNNLNVYLWANIKQTALQLGEGSSEKSAAAVDAFEVKGTCHFQLQKPWNTSNLKLFLNSWILYFFFKKKRNSLFTATFFI